MPILTHCCKKEDCTHNIADNIALIVTYFWLLFVGKIYIVLGIVHSQYTQY